MSTQIEASPRAAWCTLVSPSLFWILCGAVFAATVLGTALASSASGAAGSVPAVPVVPAARHFAPEPGCTVALATAAASSERRAAEVLVPASRVRPFYRDAGTTLAVNAFRLDRSPVARHDFLEFVRCRPEFRRSRVLTVLAEPGYLRDWTGDLAAGPEPDAAVRFVSWFAARAYCESRGQRLPTTLEWERALGAPGTANETRGAALSFAMGHAAPDIAPLGVSFAGIWEWTLDFNSAPVASGTALSQFCGDGIRSNRPEDYAAFLRYSFRSSLKGNYTLENLGFRCASEGPA